MSGGKQVIVEECGQLLGSGPDWERLGMPLDRQIEDFVEIHM
jgi:hypothetical protein